MLGRYSKEKYIDMINNSSLFEIDKERDFALYQAERNRFITLLYEYYLEFVSTRLAQEFSYEFMIAVDECLKYYNKENGLFLNYFSIAFKQKYIISEAKQKADATRGGIHITEDDSKLISKINKLLKSKNMDDISEDKVDAIASMLNISKDKLIDLLDVNTKAVAVSNIVNTDDGVVDLFDKCTIEETSVDDQDVIIEHLNYIEKIYNGLQNRGKTNEIISALLTADVIKEVSDVINIKELKYKFIDKNIVDIFDRENKIPTNKEIASFFEVSEPSISRTYATFKKKLQ